MKQLLRIINKSYFSYFETKTKLLFINTVLPQDLAPPAHSHYRRKYFDQLLS